MYPPNVSRSNRSVKLSKSPRPPYWSGSRKWRFWLVMLVGICFFAASSLLSAHGGGNGGGMGGGNGGGMGGNGGGNSGQNNHGNQSQQGGHYRDPFWSPWYPGYGGAYDSDYWYTPTPEQAETARKRVKEYLVAVQKGRRRAATHRYIAVETLRPTKTQLADYQKKRANAKAAGTQLSSRWVEPGQLRCMMVFDTQSKEFVGSGCYVIGSLPSIGTVAKFDTFSAEYVGASAL